MLPFEEVQRLNKRLSDQYGKTENLPNWRIVFSEDQLEKIWTNHTKDGFLLLEPQLIEVPKYSQWIKEKYVLERLTVVPEINRDEIITPLSYEPMWVFEQPKTGNPIDPVWPAIAFVIENVLYSQEHSGYTKYKDPDSNPKESLERKEARLRALEEELFGNETDITDALAYKEGVGYTKKES